MDGVQLAAFLALINTPTLPGLGPHRRADARPIEQLQSDLDAFFVSNKITPRQQPHLHSAALLWHDHLDASHNISQDLMDSHGSCLHGIMHRREPDYGNAKYWFCRVGKHPAYAVIAQEVTELLLNDAAGRELKTSLISGGEWDPLAFVDACEWAAAGSAEQSEVRRLQEIQAIEFKALLSTLSKGPKD